MKYLGCVLATLLYLAAGPVNSAYADEAPLPDDFLRSEDRLKLYYAYAEFKMGNHPLAMLMWENTTGTGRGEANFNLGIMHELGKGVPVSLPKAAQHYRLAAQLGSRAGAYQMGLMYFTDPALVSRDEATRWLAEAALGGDEDAKDLLESMQADQPDPLTEVRVVLAGKDYERALELLETLLEQTRYKDRALTRLGWMYELGMGVEPDLERASAYFTEAAQLGNAEAMYSIAVMYLTGAGKPIDESEGKRWLMQSAELGYPKASDKLGEIER